MAFDLGYDPSEPYKVNVPNVNNTNKGLMDIAGPGLPEGWSYGEFSGPWSNQWYDSQGIIPRTEGDDSLYAKGMGKVDQWRDYDEGTGEYQATGKKGFNWKGFAESLGEGLMGIAENYYNQPDDYQYFDSSRSQRNRD